MFREIKLKYFYKKRYQTKQKRMDTLTAMMNLEMNLTIKALANKYKINEKEALNYVMNKEMDNNKKSIKKRGRPKVEEKEKKEKGPRGRPPMEEKKRTSNVGEDLIARLIAKAKRDYLVVQVKT